jgi:hypothetical protein
MTKKREPCTRSVRSSSWVETSLSNNGALRPIRVKIVSITVLQSVTALDCVYEMVKWNHYT